MFRLIFVAGLALGLVACGSGEEEASAVADEHMDAMAGDDMMGEAEDMTEEAEDMMGEMSFDDRQMAFFQAFAEAEGTIATGTGLMYQVLREGDGASPGPRDIVEVHYEGRLVDGTIFDSSYARDETIEFPLDRVISGWTEGLQYMQVGAKHQLVIPPTLGYGDSGAGEDIPPGAVLIFDVELFNVTPVE